jgi:hypothetical protein
MEFGLKESVSAYIVMMALQVEKLLSDTDWTTLLSSLMSRPRKPFGNEEKTSSADMENISTTVAPANY